MKLLSKSSTVVISLETTDIEIQAYNDSINIALNSLSQLHENKAFIPQVKLLNDISTSLQHLSHLVEAINS